MVPVKTELFDGIYGAPKGLEGQVGGLPYYRVYAGDLGANEIYSVWELTTEERQAIFDGANILLGQVGEPIRPVSMSITELRRVDNASIEEG